MSALFRWACSISVIRLSPSLHCWCPPFSVGHAAFLFICLPGLSLLVSALCRWRCNISIRLSQVCHWWCPPFSAVSIHLSPRSVTAGVRPFPLAMQHVYSFVPQVCCHCQCPPFSAGHAAFLFISQVCHCWCPPLSVGHAAFLFMCLPGLSLVVSALCRWPCSISILLSPRSVIGVSLSIGHEAFLFICLPGPSLLVPCSISIHLSPRSVTGGVRPFPLGMQHFYSFVSRVCHWCCRPFPLFLFICLPCLSLLISALFRWPCSISIHLLSLVVSALFRCIYSFVSQVCHCWCPPFSVGHVAFLFICLPGLSLPVSVLFRWPCSISIHLPGLSLLVSALVRWPCSISIHVSPKPVTGGVRISFSFVSQVCHWCVLVYWPRSISIHLSPRSVTAGAM